MDDIQASDALLTAQGQSQPNLDNQIASIMQDVSDAANTGNFFCGPYDISVKLLCSDKLKTLGYRILGDAIGNIIVCWSPTLEHPIYSNQD